MGRTSQYRKSSNTRLPTHEINDFYATEPKAVELLLEKENFTRTIWEPAVGQGHIAEVLKSHGHSVECSDLIHRGYEGTRVQNVFDFENTNEIDVISNPPYKIAREFIEHILTRSETDVKVAMFLKLTFLESQSRREFFKRFPPRTIYIASGRLNCARNGEFEKYTSSAVAYAWFVWEVGFQGKPIIEWIN